MWKARYVSATRNETYWRTVFADDASEAMKVANRYAKKGFMCVEVIKVEGVL